MDMLLRFGQRWKNNDGVNLPAPENPPVPESGGQAEHIILNGKFGHNGF